MRSRVLVSAAGVPVILLLILLLRRAWETE